LPLEVIIAGVMVASLVLYALLGGADYGGGVWDLFAFGRRASAQRELIAEAISPVWEANHVWLILVIVILFTAFPPAFAAIAQHKITTVAAGDVARDAETETGAASGPAARCLEAEEGLEDLLELGLGDARAVVQHLQF